MRRLVFAIAVVCSPLPSSAAWIAGGTPVCVATGSQSAPQVVSDMQGGCYVVWEDRRGGDTDVYAQHLTRAGDALWATDGAQLVAGAGDQSGIAILSDGAGGLIVAWLDTFNSAFDVYVQRYDGDGNALWTPGGVPVCTATGVQTMIGALSDDSGGVILAWADGRSGLYDIYAQHIDGVGTAAWTPDGAAICTATGAQTVPRLVSDGAGGTILAWVDHRGSADDVYAQRVDATGSPLWVANGVGVGTGSDTDNSFDIVGDGAGGAIVAWRRTGLNTGSVRAQRIDPTGAFLWGTTPVVVFPYAGTPRIAEDGAGGAVVIWESSTDTGFGLLGQRLSPLGLPQWADDGLTLIDVSEIPGSYRIVHDAAGACILIWNDARTGVSNAYAQRITDASGSPVWLADGMAVDPSLVAQTITGLAPDPPNGAMLAWYENDDIYAQRLDSHLGAWGVPDPLMSSAADVPGDQGGVVTLEWQASDRDAPAWQLATYYSVWRATDFVPAGAAVEARASLASRPTLTDRSAVTADFTGPATYVQETTAGTYYWEWVGNETATESATYSLAAPTRADATPSDPALHDFEVLAHTATAFVFWESDVITGASEDNLAPDAPISLMAAREGSDVALTWSPSGQNEPDLSDYAIYRAAAPGVAVDPANLVGTTTLLALTDAGAPLTALYYVAVARDIHGNASPPSGEAVVATPTEAGRTPTLTSLQLRTNYPNPFSASTRFDVGLPARASITSEVFDVAGHLVRRAVTSDVASGWHTIAFDGRNDRGRPLPSGVYFLRVRAGGETRTARMVIQR